MLTFTFTLLFILEFIFYEDEQLVTGLFTINKSVSYYPSETRSIQLREWPPNLNLKITPSKYTLMTSSRLEKKEYSLRTDQNGFMLPISKYDDPDVKLAFLGGSTTECLFIDENIRFPYFTSVLMKEQSGLNIETYNAAKSGNTSLHSINILINKLFSISPDFVIMMHNFNDFSILLYFKNYWAATASRSNLEVNNINPTINITRSIKNIIMAFIPNTYRKVWELKENLLLQKNYNDEFSTIRNSKLTFNINHIHEEFKLSLKTFIDLSKTRALTPILMTQANRLISNPDTSLVEYKLLNDSLTDLGLDYIEYKNMYDSMNDIIREVSLENDILCIDLDRLVPSDSNFFYDLIHYTDKGSILAASIISEHLNNKIKSRKISPKN